ncbi:MAG: hypothetical protein IPH44_22855 [Myxococcales bacterium]|nr:hypothetical protein [Myxococcales bacterium]MBK7192205.1 hypothetical protein [Myxococcales bacterium]MBP6849607.1 hypothetical protein [Kofleriaceae bacterium]
MTTLRTMLLGALVVAGLVAPAEARPDRARPQVGQKAAGNGGKRDKVKQRIRIMRAMVLTEQLDLDEATAGKLFPVLDKYDDVLAKLLAERAALRDKLATARAAHKAADISAVLDQLVANQRARWTAEEQRFGELRAALTPEQAATLLDLLPEVDRKILRGLRGARLDAPDDAAPAPRGRRRGRGGGAGDLGGNPFDTRK